MCSITAGPPAPSGAPPGAPSSIASGPSIDSSVGRARRHMLWITSYTVSRARKEAKVYLVRGVVIRIAFGITYAVIRFSSVWIS